jgi:enoyl-CoA hydratase
MNTIAYDVDGRIARITLERPERGNGITLEMPRELADCVERANLDPAVRVIALAGPWRSETSPTARPRAHA